MCKEIYSIRRWDAIVQLCRRIFGQCAHKKTAKNVSSHK